MNVRLAIHNDHLLFLTTEMAVLHIKFCKRAEYCNADRTT